MAAVSASFLVVLALLLVQHSAADTVEEVAAGGTTESWSLIQTRTSSRRVDGGTADRESSIDWRATAAEFLAMMLFVVIGCGSAMGIAKEPGSAWVLQVSLTFGLAISSLAYAVGHISGGQINCAVTFGLVLVGKVSVAQGLANLGAQLLGSVIGALVLTVIYPPEKDRTGGLGSNAVGDGWSISNALVGEVLMTFLLMFVVLETAIDDGSTSIRAQACLAIGLAVFLAHSVLIPIDGCSINPTRSFGPAVVAASLRGTKGAAQGLWLFFVGPLLGAGLAVGCYSSLAAQ